MPIFEYKCKSCALIYEVLTSSCNDRNDMTQNADILCPACQGEGNKQISASSFKINGYNEKNGYSRK